jgi:diguanylate cyclase (GGDEF)-like protein
MGDGVLVLDSQNRLVDINPAAEQVLGSPQKSRIGEPVETIVSAWPEIVQAFQDVKDTNTVIPIGDPPQGYFDLRISPLYDKDRRFLGRLVVWHDITTLKRAQAELQEQAIRDPLTGLYNRRYLDETLERELARARHENHPIGFVMIDIDHFKKVNDAFGHHAGDAILQKLATQLLSQTRIGDIVCRYGGEEFLVVLPNVTADITFQIAERWRRIFLGTTMPFEYLDAKATISCGISEFPVDGNTRQELISIADKALYCAKQTGRNQVIIWQNELKKQPAGE